MEDLYHSVIEGVIHRKTLSKDLRVFPRVRRVGTLLTYSCIQGYYLGKDEFYGVRGEKGYVHEQTKWTDYGSVRFPG